MFKVEFSASIRQTQARNGNFELVRNISDFDQLVARILSLSSMTYIREDEDTAFHLIRLCRGRRNAFLEDF